MRPVRSHNQRHRKSQFRKSRLPVPVALPFNLVFVKWSSAVHGQGFILRNLYLGVELTCPSTADDHFTDTRFKVKATGTTGKRDFLTSDDVDCVT